MNQKFSFRAIQQGQTQQSHVVNAGAGQNGQALVVRAAEGTRYQLADLLTLTSPKKLQLKRVGQDLLVALPGNDVTSPDIVIKDYFNFKDLSLSGLAASGEPMVYDTSSSFNIGQSATGITPESLAANKTTAATLATASGGWFDGGMGLAALGGGGLLLAAAAGGGSSSTTTGLVSKISLYKTDTVKNSSSIPTSDDYTSAGVTGVNSGNLTGINSFLTATALSLSTPASVQTLVDSYNRITQKANGSAADTTTNDPTSADYRNLMGNSTPSTLNSESPEYKAGAVALLNDRIKDLNYSDIAKFGSVPSLSTYAAAVQAIANLAIASPSTTGTATAGITAAQLTSLGVDVTATSLTAVSDAIRASADDLSTLSTTAQLKALVEAYNTILAEANGSTADATTANPSAADYAAIGADIGTAKTDTAALARLNAIVGNLASTAVDTVGEITKLTATLDKIQTVAALDTGAELTPAQKFSADELKNLGLTGFTGSEAQNTALALKVSEAIRDKAVADVVAGTGTGFKLDNTVKTAIDQTQLERLQTLVSQEIIKNYVVDTTISTNTTIAPTLTDWQNIGVYKPITLKENTTKSAEQGYAALTATELAYLNSAADKLAATDINTQAKAQTVLEAYLRLVQEANGSAIDATTSLNPTADDLKSVGVTGDVTDSTKIASALQLNVIANVSVDKIDTVTKLQALANTVTKLMTEAAKTSTDSAGSFTTTELSNVGLRGISDTGASSNQSDFLTHVRESANDGSAIDTLVELQSLLSLSIVQAWARDVNLDPSGTPAVTEKNAAKPLEQDYKDIGVVRSMPKNTDGSAGNVPALMSVADRNALNDAIDTLVDNSATTTADDALINTLAKVQGIATSYFKILNEADPSTTKLSNYVDPYTVQTIFGGSADGLSPSLGYINEGTTAVDLTGVDRNINPVAQDYLNIGVTGTFTDARTSLLNTLIAEKNFGQVDTVKEIQTLATAVDKVLALAAKDNLLGSVDAADKLTQTQMEADLGMTGVTFTNLDHILLAIQKQDVAAADSFAELQSLVSITRIADYAGDNSTTTNPGGMPTQFDWHAIVGLTSELDANVSAYNTVVDRLDSANINALSDLQSIVNAYNHIIAAADGNKLTDPATSNADLLSDYGVVLGTGSSAYTGLGIATSDVMKLMVNANSSLGLGSVDSVGELSNIALAAGKVIALSNESTTVNTNLTGQATVSNAAGVTKSDLTLLGLDTSKIGTGSGNYDTYELVNILAEIQNLSPSQAADLATLQNKINQWAL